MRVQKSIVWGIIAIAIVAILSLAVLSVRSRSAAGVRQANGLPGSPEEIGSQGHDSEDSLQDTASPSAVTVAHDDTGHTDGPTGHEGDEGQVLGSTTGQETVYAAARCAPTATVRSYRIVAINVQITLNRFLDYDPDGRMYVLEDELARVRQEEAQNRAARQDKAAPAVSIGLQGDAIQPLVLRVNQGECLRITLRNGLGRRRTGQFSLARDRVCI